MCPPEETPIALCEMWWLKCTLGSALLKMNPSLLLTHPLQSPSPLIRPSLCYLIYFFNSQATRIIRLSMWVHSVTCHFSKKAIKSLEDVKSSAEGWKKACPGFKPFSQRAEQTGRWENKHVYLSYSEGQAASKAFCKIKVCFLGSDPSEIRGTSEMNVWMRK